MRAQLVGLSLAFLVAGGIADAPMSRGTPQPQDQNAQSTHQPDLSSVYCSGKVTDDKVPTDAYIISGEESNAKTEFHQGDYVFINKGSNQGVREGDQFSVIRAEKDPLSVVWFKWQKKLLGAMGTLYSDVGRVRVTTVQPNVSIAKVAFSCVPMLRADIVRPYEDRPTTLQGLHKARLFCAGERKTGGHDRDHERFLPRGGRRFDGLCQLGHCTGCEGRRLLPRFPLPGLAQRHPCRA